MRVTWGLDAFRADGRPPCIALGTFDGVHSGHRGVIDALKVAARAIGGESVVTTFDPHPLAVIARPAEPFLLSTLDERLRLFEASGVDAALVLRFDQAMRTMPAAQWLEWLCRSAGPRRIVVASTHTFGYNQQGTAAFLQAWASGIGIVVTVVPLLTNADMPISSSGIRERLRQGDVRTAAEWLGRWYSITGTVVLGEGRGRRLGVPTANLRIPEEKLTPARGVYAAYATAEGTTYPAAVNIGLRPTFGGKVAVVEAHLIDADLDLYGQTLEVAFVERLRAEMRFSGPEVLRRQIESDVATARVLLRDEVPPR